MDAVSSYYLTRRALYRVAARFSSVVLYSAHPVPGVGVLQKCCLHAPCVVKRVLRGLISGHGESFGVVVLRSHVKISSFFIFGVSTFDGRLGSKWRPIIAHLSSLPSCVVFTSELLCGFFYRYAIVLCIA